MSNVKKIFLSCSNFLFQVFWKFNFENIDRKKILFLLYKQKVQIIVKDSC